VDVALGTTDLEQRGLPLTCRRPSKGCVDMTSFWRIVSMDERVETRKIWAQIANSHETLSPSPIKMAHAGSSKYLGAAARGTVESCRNS
jgi:hypothetical protein